MFNALASWLASPAHATFQTELAAQAARDLAQAQRDFPNDTACGFCGKPLDFADDIGYFYLNPRGDDGASKPACKACYNGLPGIQHRAHYGEGDR
jgi:hypothetical protein